MRIALANAGIVFSGAYRDAPRCMASRTGRFGIRFHTARALADLRREPGRARALAAQARAYYARTPDAFAAELAEIDAWLAAHPR